MIQQQRKDIIKMRRFKECELDFAINDNEKRGYELIKKIKIPRYRNHSVVYTYYAEMKKVK